jgi:hypothetical protein
MKWLRTPKLLTDKLDSFGFVHFNWYLLEELFQTFYGHNSYILIPVFDYLWHRLFDDKFRGDGEWLVKYGVRNIMKESVEIRVREMTFETDTRIDFLGGGCVQIALEKHDINPYYDHGFELFELIDGIYVIGHKRPLKKFFNMLERRLVSEVSSTEIFEGVKKIFREGAKVNGGIEMLMQYAPVALALNHNINSYMGGKFF